MNFEIPLPTETDTKLTNICHRLLLDASIKEKAKGLLLQYPANSNPPSPLEAVLRCSLLAASHLEQLETMDGNTIDYNPISATSLFKDIDLPSLLPVFQNFLPLVPPAASKRLSKIYRDLEIGSMLYQAYEDTWTELQISGKEQATIKQLLWMVYICARGELLKRSSNYDANALLLYETLQFCFELFPYTITVENPQLDFCQFLANRLDISEERCPVNFVQIPQFLREMLTEGDLRSNSPGSLEGIFSSCNLRYNISHIGERYQKSIRVSLIDERNYMTSCIKMKTPMKNPVPISSAPDEEEAVIDKKTRSQRILDWNFTINFNNSLKQVKNVPMSPYVPMTPGTATVEMNHWWKGIQITDEKAELTPEQAIRLEEFKANFAEIIENLSEIEQSELENNMLPQLSAQNTAAILLTEIYTRALYALKQKNTHSITELPSEHMDPVVFEKCIQVCSAASVLFTNNISSVPLHRLLLTAGVCAFDFWKVINSFVQIDVRMPLPLKRYFRELEIRVLSSLAWEEGSPLVMVVRQYSEGCLERDHVTDMFFRRVLSLSAHRLLEIGDALQIPENIKESVWESLKHVLSEHTEMLFSRHLDILLGCTLYAVCKLRQAITFKQFIQTYYSLYIEEPTLFTDIQIHETRGDITQFYNVIYLPAMKKFLTQNTHQTNPRILALSPRSPLRANLPAPISYSSLTSPMRSPLTSPYMTPRTRQLQSKEPVAMNSGRLIQFEGSPGVGFKTLATIIEPSENVYREPLNLVN